MATAADSCWTDLVPGPTVIDVTIVRIEVSYEFNFLKIESNYYERDGRAKQGKPSFLRHIPDGGNYGWKSTGCKHFRCLDSEGKLRCLACGFVAPDGLDSEII